MLTKLVSCYCYGGGGGGGVKGAGGHVLGLPSIDGEIERPSVLICRLSLACNRPRGRGLGFPLSVPVSVTFIH